MSERRNIKFSHLRLLQKIKNFLFNKRSREFLIFLFFFSIAAGFWLLQTLNNDYELEFSIPVRLKGVPNNVVITSENATELNVKVRDKGTVLLNYMLSKNLLPITLEYEEYKASRNHIRIFGHQFEKQVQARLNASSVLLSIKPDTLEYYYATGKSKRVPVRLRGEVHAGQLYYISDTLFTPDSVLVYAPAHMLDTIKVAYTENVNLENVSDTLVQKVKLAHMKAVKFVPDMVDMTFPVDVYVDKTVEVPIHGTNFPANKTLRTFPSKVSVVFQVGMSRNRDINEDDFLIHVSYEELLRLGSNKYPVKIKSIPNGVRVIRFSPPQVDFLIEQYSSNGN